MIDSCNPFRKRLVIAIILAMIVLLGFIPLYMPGITSGDDLQRRFLGGYYGYEHYLNWCFSIARQHGRVLASIMMPIECLDFISPDRVIYKIPQVIMLGSCFASFYLLIKELFDSRVFALLCSLSCILLLPLSFEYTLPNTFNFFGVGTTLSFLSLWLFDKYLKTENKVLLCVSMVFQFLSESTYEMFMSLVPLYFMIAIIHNKINKQRILKNAFWPLIVGVLFLVAYVAARFIFPTQYSGNVMVFDIGKSIHVITVLVNSMVPLFYINNPYYQKILDANSFPDDPTSWLRVCGIIILVTSLLIVFSLTQYLNKNRKKIDNASKDPSDCKQSILKITAVLFVASLMVVFPMVPYSFSQKYQAIVGVYDGFLAQPGSFLSFFAVTFIICYILWIINKILSKKCQKKILAIICGFVILSLFVSYIGSVQYANEIYYNIQVSDDDRLCYMEDFVRSDELYDLGINEYHCPDFYKTQHLMYFYNSPDVWTTFSEKCGHGIKLPSSKPTLEDNRIYFPDDRYFHVWHDGIPTIISKYEIPNEMELVVIDNETITVVITDVIHNSSGWYVADCDFTLV